MYLHIASYKFIFFENLPALQREFIERTQALGLKGTILLAEEGINLMVAGLATAIRDFKRTLQEYPALRDLKFKESLCQEMPFNRMLVKIKKEVIPLGLTVKSPAPRISAQQLKTWLDENRDVVLLDTRNHYEIRLGTFNNAVHLNLGHFRDFAARTRNLPEALKKKPVVTFCTGGIRCEKAAPFLIEAGFQEVYQLDGGILQYFMDCGNSHYQGECFVFDRRVALNEALQETGTVQCFACLAPVTPEEQLLPSYIPDISCPHCS